jgi:hypothetical protein
MRLRTLIATASLGCASLAAPASAQAPDPAALGAQLRGWFAALLAPKITLPEPPLTVTRKGDRYVFALPADLLGGRKTDEAAAVLRPLDASRWAVEALRFPPKGKFEIPTDTKTKKQTVEYAVGAHSERGTIDTSMASRSDLAVELRDVEITTRDGKQSDKEKFERYAMQVVLVPGADGRFDLAQEADIEGWSSSATLPGVGALQMELRRGRQQMRLSAVSSAQVSRATAAIGAIIGELAGSDGKASPSIDAQARVLVASLRDIATRIEADQTMDDLSVEVANVGTVSVDEARFGIGGESRAGKLHAWLDFSMAGLDADALPKNMRRYLPSRIAMRPSLAGVDIERVHALMEAAASANPDSAKLDAEANAILSDPSVRIGLEFLRVEMDQLRIEGNALVRTLGPQKYGLEARLAAQGLDELMAEANKDPELRDMLPFLAMAKGMGRAEGGKIVWDIAATDDQVLVNGVDMRTLGGGSAPPGKGARPGSKR